MREQHAIEFLHGGRLQDAFLGCSVVSNGGCDGVQEAKQVTHVSQPLVGAGTLTSGCAKDELGLAYASADAGI